MSSTQPFLKNNTLAQRPSQNGHGVQVVPTDKYNAILVANTHPPDWQNPEPAPVYNLVVIGGGSAGLLAAVGAAGLGAKVALIERHLLGGDCLNTGCVPSKTIIRSAKAMGDLKLADDLGIEIPPGVKAYFGAVMERMRRIRAGLSYHDSAQRFTDEGVDVFLGEGRFTGRDTIEVAGATLRFKSAVVATGSRAAVPPIEGLAEAGYLTNETFFSLTERPNRMAIIGAGPIGSELAQAMQRLGCQVTVFDMLPQVLGREDREAAKLVEQAMRHDGVEFVLEAKLKRVVKQGADKVVHYEQHGQEQSLVVDEILVAAGRVPNVERLNLKVAGVAYHKKGIEVNDYLQTTNPIIYAAGDVGLKYQFTHTADASARLVLQNALFLGRKKMSALTIPWCTYTDPEVAHVGLYPADAEAAGIAIDTFVQPFSKVDRAVADGEEAGFVKIHVKQGSDQIVGATIVARHAGEIISEITTAMVGGLGLKILTQVIHPYPTQAEAIRKVADSYNRTRLTPTVQSLFTRWFAFNRTFNFAPAAQQLQAQVSSKPALSIAGFTVLSTLAYYLWSMGQKK
jgi:pyruvate/2-oxoglutarate dehydrogenase complex dihydrolipoamide dehydrogenase (E3) component